MLGKRCAGRLKAPPQKNGTISAERRDRGKFMICKKSAVRFLVSSLRPPVALYVVAEVEKRASLCDERSGKKQRAIRG
jgi:hypothetical protein